jgi:hypothetical protein
VKGVVFPVSSTAKPSATLQDCLEQRREILTGFIAIVEGLIAVVVGHESAASIREETDPLPEPSVPVLALLLQAAGSSAHTLSRLSDLPGLHTRDCYSIARSVVEVAANICYIIAEGPAAAELAMRHARQKSYRDLERESKIGDSSSPAKLTRVPSMDSKRNWLSLHRVVTVRRAGSMEVLMIVLQQRLSWELA